MKKTIVTYRHSNDLRIDVEKCGRYFEVWIETPKTLLKKMYRTDNENNARMLAQALDDGYSIRYNE